MAAQLVQWVNTLGLTQKVDSLEECFADGVLLAEILTVFDIISAEEFRNLNLGTFQSVNQRARNFESLEPFLTERLHIPVSRPSIGRIICAGPDSIPAVSRLLLELKVAIERDGLTKMSRKTRKPSSVKDRSEHQGSGEHRAAKRTPNPDPMLLKAVRNQLTKKQLKEAIHLSNFEQHRIRQEKRIFDLEARELQEFEEALEQSRAKTRARLEEKKKAGAVQLAKERQDWKANRDRKQAQLEGELNYELTCWAKRRALEEKRRMESRGDQVQGIEQFEKTLKKFGLEELPMLVLESPIADHVREASKQARVENMEYMRRLRARKREAAEARRNRLHRRNKAMVERQQMQIELEESRAREALRARTEQVALSETQLASERKRRRFGAARKKLLARSCCSELEKNRGERFREAVLRDQRRLRTLKSSSDTANEQVEGIPNAVKGKRNSKAFEKVSKVVGEIVDLLEAVLDSRQTKAGEPRLIPLAEWAEMKRLFVEGELSRRSSCSKKGSSSNSESVFQCHATVARGLLVPNGSRPCQGGDPLRGMASCLEILTGGGVTADRGSCSSLKDIVCLSGRHGKAALDLLSRSLEHRYQVERFDVKKLIEMAHDHVGHEGVSRTKPQRKQQVSKLTLANLNDRGALLKELGSIRSEEDALESFALIKLLVYDIKQERAKAGVVLQGAPSTVDQVALLEFLLRTDGDQSEQGYLHFREQYLLDPSDPKREFGVLERYRLLLVANGGSESDLGLWKGVAESAVLIAPALQDTTPTALRAFLSSFHAEVSKKLHLGSTSTLPSYHDPCFWEVAGERLLRRRDESLALPPGVVDAWSCDAVDAELQAVRRSVSKYDMEAAVAWSMFVSYHERLDGMVAETINAGLRVLRGEEGPAGLALPPGLRGGVLAEWHENLQAAPNRAEFVRNTLDSLETKLWQISRDYCRLVKGVFASWKCEKPGEREMEDTLRAFCGLVDSEMDYYREAREHLKHFFYSIAGHGGRDEADGSGDVADVLDCVLQSVVYESDDDPRACHIPSGSLNEYTAGAELNSRLDQAWRLQARRSSRQLPGGSQHAALALAHLNSRFRERIRYTAKVAASIVEYTQHQWRLAFRYLEDTIIKRISYEDVAIREFVVQLKDEASSLKPNSGSGVFLKLDNDNIAWVPENLEPKDLRENISQLAVIDLRQESEASQGGTIPGSLAYATPSCDQLEAYLQALANAVLVCQDGEKSYLFQLRLRMRGVYVKRLVGGMNNWVTSGFALVSQRATPVAESRSMAGVSNLE